MKRKIIASTLGFASLVTLSVSSYGQGTVAFQNYNFGGTPALNAPVTFATSGHDGATPVTAGEAVGSTFTADLLFSLNGGSTYTLLTQAASGQPSYPTSFGAGSIVDGDNADFAGYFFGNGVTIPGYTSGTIFFIVEAFNGTSYTQSLATGGDWAGQSAAFSLPSIATGVTPAGDFGSAMQPFTVSVTAVPEPTTLALAGLGGLASLVMLRRKHA